MSTTKATAPGIRRRTALLAGAAGLIRPAWANHDSVGPVRPSIDMPELGVTLDSGRPAMLRSLLLGRVTALQFVLTGCSATCPLLGAVFAATQQRLTSLGRPDIQLVSLGIDPLSDTPASLRGWLDRFGAGPRWRAVLPGVADSSAVAALSALGAGRSEGDQHNAAVLLIDRGARLVYRSEDLPDSRQLVQALLSLV